MKATYVHTNLVARDWIKLAAFYERAFGCKPVSVERNLSGDRLEEATLVPDAHIRGIHLLLPGWGDNGPTLEIFEYTPKGPVHETMLNRPGFGHIAFRVDDVSEARKVVLAHGGKDHGRQVSVPVAGEGVVTFVYMTDPEGNVIELQSWTPEVEETSQGRLHA